MKITLHDESIDIEVGQKIVFYGYRINDGKLEVITDETFVDGIDEESNQAGFKNNKHSSTLHFYQNDRTGEKYFLSDTKENRLRFLKSMIKYYKSQQNMYDYQIKETYELLERYISRSKEFTDNLESVKKLIDNSLE